MFQPRPYACRTVIMTNRVGDREAKRRKWWARHSKRLKKEAETNQESSVISSSEKKEDLLDKKKRYILFVGNLSYNTSVDDVVQHFMKRGVPVKQVRLLTQKGSDKSRGCCFLEFDCVKHQQNALKFHHSKLNGRTINIEITCGGGGNGERRRYKIKKRNNKFNKL